MEQSSKSQEQQLQEKNKSNHYQNVGIGATRSQPPEDFATRCFRGADLHVDAEYRAPVVPGNLRNRAFHLRFSRLHWHLFSSCSSSLWPTQTFLRVLSLETLLLESRRDRITCSYSLYGRTNTVYFRARFHRPQSSWWFERPIKIVSLITRVCGAKFK